MANEVKRKASGAVTSLSAKWQLDAALLSRPVDLTTLVSMSRTTPDKFMEDDTLHRLISLLLNEKNKIKSDKDTKLDVLNILANVAGGSKKSIAEVRVALGGISEWFDEYIATEEADPGEEPELHKAMILLLARCWDYRLKTEDVLELTQGNRRIALCTVVGILEDGETYSTELKQRQSPGAGKMGQWEHELVCQRYEKPLLLQTCRLLRGFTHPGTYFEASSEELALYSVEKFAEEMDGLLDITLRSRLVEKLAIALYDCLFEANENDKSHSQKSQKGGSSSGTDLGPSTGAHSRDQESMMILEESDHMAVVSVHAFLQNLYFYASENNEEFRRHMLVETLLIPRLVLPYLDRCVLHATILNSRAEAYSDMLEGDVIAEMALHNPQLVKGIAASLRTLIIASFRAPATQFVMALLKRLNPTAHMLRARSFCKHHEYIFALLCLLNVNMGALDLQHSNDTAHSACALEGLHANTLLQELSIVFKSMDSHTQARVVKRVMSSGALPISRDTPSYAAVMSILYGGEAGQLEYSLKKDAEKRSSDPPSRGEDAQWNSRAEAKSDIRNRLASMEININNLTYTNAKEDSSTHTQNTESQIVPKETDTQSDRRTNQYADSKSEIQDPAQEKERKGVERDLGSDSKDFRGSRHLDDLPSLAAGNLGTYQERSKARELTDNDIKVLLSLELPQGGLGSKSGIMGPGAGMGVGNGSGGTKSKGGRNDDVDSSIPKEFLCSINNHVMKDPVRSVHSTDKNVVYERATIELWLSSRGSVCPISNSALRKQDLVPVEDLKNRHMIMPSSEVIKRYHIQQTSMRTTSMPDDDLYDF